MATLQRICGLVQKWIQAYKGLSPLLRLFIPLQVNLKNILDTRGPLGQVMYMKQLRTSILSRLAKGQREPGISYFRTWPKCLGASQITVQNDESSEHFNQCQRLVQTILFSSRALQQKADPNFASITDPAKGTVNVSLGEVRSFWRTLGFYVPMNREPSIPKAVVFSNFHFTVKSGPNGHALFTSLLDFIQLEPEQREAQLVLGGKELGRRMRILSQAIPYQVGLIPPLKNGLRKIVYFNDKEDKVRVIAILDYWSQAALKPLHLFLFKCQKRIPQDCTFDQGKLQDKLSKQDGVKHSFDLKAATDRFPIKFIEKVLEGRFPKAFVKAWALVMCGLPFKVPSRNELIHYSTGTPMGAYTSWAAFAQAHHFLIYQCALEAKRPWASVPYALLGDDIVIVDKEIAEIYFRRITELGVEVSIAKSHISEDLQEFAKRLFYKGSEITPFPISALKEMSSRSYFQAQLFLDQAERGWWEATDISNVTSSFYEYIFASNSSFRAKVGEIAFIVSRLGQAIKGVIPGAEFLEEFCVRNKLPTDLEFTQDDFNRFMSFMALEQFAESNESLLSENNDLGHKAVNLVIYQSGLTELEIANNMESVPMLNVHGVISELLVNQWKQAHVTSQSEEGWSKQLKTITIPVSDRVYSERTRDTITRATFLLGRRLTDKVQEFAYLKALERSWARPRP